MITARPVDRTRIAFIVLATVLSVLGLGKARLDHPPQVAAAVSPPGR